MNRILVTGATGNVGRHVVDQLIAAGAQFRAMTRDPAAATLPADIDVVRGDLTVPASLDSCLREIETVFLVWVAPSDAIEGALDRIAKHARRIVYLTAPLKTPHPFFQQPNPSRVIAERVERLIEQSGLEWTFVRAGVFAGNARHFWGPQIRAGGVPVSSAKPELTNAGWPSATLHALSSMSMNTGEPRSGSSSDRASSGVISSTGSDRPIARPIVWICSACVSDCGPVTTYSAPA